MNAGDLREPLTILSCETAAGDTRWKARKTTWGKAELTGKLNLFSKVGIGVSSATFTMREQPLTLNEAILWRGAHYFLTEIKKISDAPAYLEITAAKIEPQECVLYDSMPPRRFPGCVVEKYYASNAERAQFVSTVRLILVTPKCMETDAGKLVELSGKYYQVSACHTADPYKNEYEMERKEDN